MADAEAPSDVVEREGKQLRLIREGKATILVPLSAKTDDKGQDEQQIFYNPIQQYNRDLSVLAIKAYGHWALERRAHGRRAPKHGKKRKRGHDDDAAPSTAQAPGLERETARGDQAAAAQPKQGKTPFTILDALSASGLRALRYAHELPFVTEVTANDLSASAAAAIKLNVEFNGVQDVVAVTNQDALALMYRGVADRLSATDRPGSKFDVVDLDPYGSAAPFFDAALQSVRDDGGLLCITCTDSAVWAGHSYCEKTFALYGGIPLKGPHAHEAGLRLILGAIATTAARHGLHIEPLLSLSIDFYTKLMVRVTRSPLSVKFLAAKTMLVYSCDQGCGSWETQPLLRSRPAANKKGSGSFFKHGVALGPTMDRLCQHCGSKTHISGPMYAGHMHSQEFIQRVLNEIPQASSSVYGTLPRLEGMLRTAMEELMAGPEAPPGVDAKEAELAAVDACPFFVIPGRLGSVVSCATPSDDLFRGALLHLGYWVGRSHCRPGSIKTDAPWSTIWWVMAEWIRQRSPVKTSKFRPQTAAWKILRDTGLLEQPGEGGAAESAAQEESGDAGPRETAAAAAEERQAETEEQRVGPRPGGAAEGGEEAGQGGERRPSEDELRKTLVFDEDLARLGRGRESQRYVRYQMNPRENWGPLRRAKGR